MDNSDEEHSPRNGKQESPSHEENPTTGAVIGNGASLPYQELKDFFAEHQVPGEDNDRLITALIDGGPIEPIL